MRLTAFAFLLSGAAALVYQVSWQRLLVLQSGVAIYSVATIVAAFMAGLGIGSWLGGVVSPGLSPRKSLRAFALIEVGIGLFGAVSAPLFYDWLYLEHGQLYAEPWLAALLHFSGLLLPTALMGMSLPFLTRARVSNAAGAGRTIGTLYALNTLGAGAGALLTPWVLLRLLGVRGALLTAAAVNLTAALLALLARPVSDQPPAETPAEREADPSVAAQPFGLWLGLYGLSGFVALSLEILWFRVVDVAVKATAFTFGTVLSLYLIGFGMGTLLGTWALKRIRRPLAAFLLCECALLLYAGLVIGALVWLPPNLPGLAWFVGYWTETRGVPLGQVWNASLARLYLLLPAVIYGPPTVLMGMAFPILQRAVQDEPRTSGRKVGLLQAANILGCVAGSLLMGFVSLDHLGSTGSLQALVALGILFASIGIWRGGRPRLFSALALALAVLAVALPSNERLWRRLHGSDTEQALVEEDATGVPVLRKVKTGVWHMSVNGIPHSWLPYGGSHTTLGALPAVIHPAPRRIAVIGLGSGNTAWAAGLRPETELVRVFEICRGQPALLRRLAEIRPGLEGLHQFLSDPRMDFCFADGRQAVDNGQETYDVIQLDPLHSDNAYAGHLYSLEFYSRVAAKLRSGGLICTWAPTPRTYTTFVAALPHVIDCGSVLIGSRDPIPLEPLVWIERSKDHRLVTYLGRAATQNLRRQLRRARPADPPARGHILPNTDLFPRDEFARHWRDR